MKSEPALDARCRDKFLVQSVAITGDKEFTNVQQIVCSKCPSLAQRFDADTIFLHSGIRLKRALFRKGR